MGPSAPGHLQRRADSGHRSSAGLLAWVWLVVIVYASLFPFSGWRWPAGMALWEPLGLPWPRYFIPFDITSNLLGYLPLGLLVGLAQLRQGRLVWRALLWATLAGAATSYLMEATQTLLPPRVPSLLDWVLNAAGALLGGALAGLMQWTGALRLWQKLRERWLVQGDRAAMVLLLLWPVALLFPMPLPLGLGQVAGPLREGLIALLDEVPWAAPVWDWLATGGDSAARLAPGGQVLAMVLGLLAPGLLAFAVALRGWRRLWLAMGAAGVGAAATTLSTALNFGPDHAMAWLTPEALAAGGLGLLALALLVWAGRRLAAGLALVALTGLVMLVNQAATDPYFAQSLQGWEQGRFIRFHGVAQWVGWLWPYAAMAWVLVRLVRQRAR